MTGQAMLAIFSAGGGISVVDSGRGRARAPRRPAARTGPRPCRSPRIPPSAPGSRDARSAGSAPRSEGGHHARHPVGAGAEHLADGLADLRGARARAAWPAPRPSPRDRRIAPGRQRAHEVMALADPLTGQSRGPLALDRVQVGRQRDVAGCRDPPGHVLDVLVHAPDLLDDHDRGQGQRRPSRAGPGTRSRHRIGPIRLVLPCLSLPCSRHAEAAQNSRRLSSMPLRISNHQSRAASLRSVSKREIHSRSFGSFSPSTSRSRTRNVCTKSMSRADSQ